MVQMLKMIIATKAIENKGSTNMVQNNTMVVSRYICFLFKMPKIISKNFAMAQRKIQATVIMSHRNLTQLSTRNEIFHGGYSYHIFTQYSF